MYHGRSDATTVPLMSWVLVADDDPALREVLCAALQETGYGTIEAADGPETLDALRDSARPLLVLLDYQMPGMTGGEVLSTVEADPRMAGRHAFVLVCAAPETLPPWLVLWADREGVRIVPKPFDLDVLLAAVAEAAGRLRGAPPEAPRTSIPV